MNAIEAAFRLVLDVSWRVSCVVIVFFALRAVLRTLVPARVLFWVWIALAARLLAPFTVPVAWSPFNLARLENRMAPSLQEDGPPGPSQVVRSAELPEPNGRTGRSVLLPGLRSDGVIVEHSFFQCAAVAWSLGVVVLLLMRGWVHLRFRSQLRLSSTAPDSSLAALVAETADELGVRGVGVAITSAVGAPALYGAFRPKLLFPPGLAEKLSRHELHLVILHELGHWRRRDLLAHGIIHTTRIVHWFNPVVWIAARAAKHDCELACDEFVVRHLGSVEPRIYGAVLLKIIGLVSHAPHARLGLGIVESNQQIKRRIQMIVANPSSPMTRTLLGGALLALITGLSLTREAGAQPPAEPTSITPSTSSTVSVAAPTGWRETGDEFANYLVGVDPTQPHNGSQSAYVKSLNPSPSSSHGMTQMCSAEAYLGKRLRLSAWMKSVNANDRGAHLWFRVDGVDTQAAERVVVAFDNMVNRPVKGTTEWKEYSVVLDVPANATALAYGFFIQGTGQAWVSGMKMEEVGPEVPSTNLDFERPKKPTLRKAPVNLAFN